MEFKEKYMDLLSNMGIAFAGHNENKLKYTGTHKDQDGETMTISYGYLPSHDDLLFINDACFESIVALHLLEAKKQNKEVKGLDEAIQFLLENIHISDLQLRFNESANHVKIRKLTGEFPSSLRVAYPELMLFIAKSYNSLHTALKELKEVSEAEGNKVKLKKTANLLHKEELITDFFFGKDELQLLDMHDVTYNKEAFLEHYRSILNEIIKEYERSLIMRFDGIFDEEEIKKEQEYVKTKTELFNEKVENVFSTIKEVIHMELFSIK